MIAMADLRASARSYLAAARTLNRRGKGKPDAAVYLCGYAVEIALKARICRTLAWAEFPETPGEFRSYQSFKTHDLDTLLHLAGGRVERLIKGATLTEWSLVRLWKPEQRYNPVGTYTEAEAAQTVAATAKIVEVLL